MIDVEVPTQDGVARASLHAPEGSGPWPAVIMYPDAGGTREAVEDDPDSPHYLAAGVRAVVYVGGAENDASFDDEQAARLHEAYGAAGVEHTIDQYTAAHGFAVADNPTYDEAAAERHWTAMSALYASALS